MAGWRVYVTNTRQERLPHAQALGHYRAQWIAEHGYHRFKASNIPGLPLLVQQVGSQVRTCLVEMLSPVQRYILELLHLSPACYDLTRTFAVAAAGGGG